MAAAEACTQPGLSKQVNAALAPTGWQVMEATANATTGFVKVVLEQRDTASGEGRSLVLLRSCWGAAVVERRDILELRPGMYRHFWEVVDHLGGRKYGGIRSAFRGVATYLEDNSVDRVLARKCMRMLAGAFGPEPEDRQREPVLVLRKP